MIPARRGNATPNWKLPKKGWSRWEKLTEWDVYVEREGLKRPC